MTASPIVCVISRSSHRVPPCEGCEVRRFQCEERNGFKHVDTHYVRTFASADDLLVWIKTKDVGGVVLGPMREEYRSLDDGPVPEWDVEIYDDYRE